MADREMQFTRTARAANLGRRIWLPLTLICLSALFVWMFSLQSPTTELSLSEQQQLLEFARDQLIASTSGDDLIHVDLDTLPKAIRQHGAAFVSLTVDGNLRGCMIDQFEPHEPLITNVLRNTQYAVLADERFATVVNEEIEEVRVEISVVYDIVTLTFEGADNLLSQLTPSIDGVILRVGDEIATYLPSVWQLFPDSAEFLSQLCTKAGWEPNRWRFEPYPIVSTYRVFTFSEPE